MNSCHFLKATQKIFLFALGSLIISSANIKPTTAQQAPPYPAEPSPNYIRPEFDNPNTAPTTPPTETTTPKPTTVQPSSSPSIQQPQRRSSTSQSVALSPLEQAVLSEINRARTNPSAYADWMENMKKHLNGNILEIPGQPRIMTYTGAAGFDEAIQYLRSHPPVPSVDISSGLYLAARDHTRDLANTTNVGHTGSDGSDPTARGSRYGKGFVWENISAGDHQSAELFIMFMLIDDWVPGRGHRLNNMKPEHRLVGVSCGPNPQWGSICVMDFSNEYVDR